MSKEIWKDIKGYEGLYQISNYGNIRSIKRKNVRKDRILKSRLGSNGYYFIFLYKKSERKFFKINRLVAVAFIPNLENKPQVNHINGIKTDNRVENLEWVTARENINHALNTGLKKHHIIMQYSLDNEFIKEWNRVSELRKYGFRENKIYFNCSGKSKTYKGFIFKYKN